jgi:ABC-type nickel/cobalt efflux system permease component RcnA
MNKTLLTVICLAAFMLLASCASAAQNPFTGKGRATESSRDSGISAPPFLSPLLTKSAELQSEIRSRLAGFAADIRKDPMGGDFWLFILLSFAYGALHALGPGHGKLFAVSYFIGRPGSLASGLMLGNLTMLAHVLSATLLVMAGFLLLHGSGALTAESARGALETVSFALLTLLGLFLAFRAVHNAKKGGRVHEIGRNRGGRGSLVLMALFGGLVPCPGATLILVYAVSQDIVAPGLAAMLAISLGMGLTTSAFALAAIYSRGFLLGLAESRSRIFERLHLALTVFGALAIAALGAVMLLGKIQ